MTTHCVKMIALLIFLFYLSTAISEKCQETDEVEKIWSELHSVKQSFDARFIVQDDKISQQREQIMFQNEKIALLQSKMMRLQQTSPDKKNQYSSLGCLSDHLVLSCPNGRAIRVTYAEYGQYYQECSGNCCAPDPWYDCTEDVSTSNPEDWAFLLQSCDQKESCSFEYTGAVVSECEIDYIADYMLINYDCSPDPVEPVVGFTAWASETRTYADKEIVIFDEVDSNFGGHYNPATSTFSCPHHGTYLFSITLLTELGSYMYAHIMKDSAYLATIMGDNISDVHNQASAFVITDCYPGQVLYVRSQYAGTMFGSGYRRNTFSGYLLQRLD